MMEVWVRELTFFDVQQAAQSMFQMDGDDVSLNLEGYWRYAFSNWVVRTNPELTVDDMMNLNAYVGQQIASLLPKPDELAEAMQGFYESEQLRVRQFLKKKVIKNPSDLEMQMQLFAYIVAKHYNISLHEVYQMSEAVFKQSLSWALAINEEERIAERKQNLENSTESTDVVDFDYSFLEGED